MIALVFDVETTGFLVKGQPPPFLVQLGLVLLDGNDVRASGSFIVKPNGWEIPEATARVHGISNEIALRVGLPNRTVVAIYCNLRSIANVLVAHNVEFDLAIMNGAIQLTGIEPAHSGPKRVICTKEASETLVNLPPTAKMLAAGFNKPKSPSLGELYRFLFNEEVPGWHDALADAQACARCFIELRNRGAIE